jgi:hypothetical protein
MNQIQDCLSSEHALDGNAASLSSEHVVDGNAG